MFFADEPLKLHVQEVPISKTAFLFESRFYLI